MPKPNIVYAQTVSCPDGRKVRNLFYDDGSFRFRLNSCPLVLEEAFLSGNAQLNSIIKLSPKLTPVAPAEDSPLQDRDSLLVELVTRFGNDPVVAPLVPHIQEQLGIEDVGA